MPRQKFYVLLPGYAFTEPPGLIEAPLNIVSSRSILPAKGTAHNAETTIPEISNAAPTISIM
jgi:hypothetical protein